MTIAGPKILIILIFTIPLFLGCSGPSKYSQVNFCWTTEYIIAPDKRFLTLNAKYEDVIKSITEDWVKYKNGEVVYANYDFKKFVKLNDNWELNFSNASNIAYQERTSYADNDFSKHLNNEQFKKMQTYMNSAVSLYDTESKSCLLKLKIGQRSKTITWSEIEPDYLKNLTIGLLLPPTVVLTKENKKSATLSFYSCIYTSISERDGKTVIYTKGVPVNIDKNQEANYGQAVGYPWWSLTQGTEESNLIYVFYVYLSQKFPPVKEAR